MFSIFIQSIGHSGSRGIGVQLRWNEATVLKFSMSYGYGEFNSLDLAKKLMGHCTAEQPTSYLNFNYSIELAEEDKALDVCSQIAMLFSYVRELKRNKTPLSLEHPVARYFESVDLPSDLSAMLRDHGVTDFAGQCETVFSAVMRLPADLTLPNIRELGIAPGGVFNYLMSFVPEPVPAKAGAGQNTPAPFLSDAPKGVLSAVVFTLMVPKMDHFEIPIGIFLDGELMFIANAFASDDFRKKHLFDGIKDGDSRVAGGLGGAYINRMVLDASFSKLSAADQLVVLMLQMKGMGLMLSSDRRAFDKNFNLRTDEHATPDSQKYTALISAWDAALKRAGKINAPASWLRGEKRECPEGVSFKANPDHGLCVRYSRAFRADVPRVEAVSGAAAGDSASSIPSAPPAPPAVLAAVANPGDPLSRGDGFTQMMHRSVAEGRRPSTLARRADIGSANSLMFDPFAPVADCAAPGDVSSSEGSDGPK